MLQKITYEDLRNFTGLPVVRRILLTHDVGFIITGLSKANVVKQDAIDKIKSLPSGATLQKLDLVTSRLPHKEELSQLMESLHKLSHTVFNNISHALELPWEKYLGEMHEWTARGTDELRVVSSQTDVANEWSTLTIVVNSDSPRQALVLFGEALSVFSEGITKQPAGANLEAQLLAESFPETTGNWISYYVRPNEDVMYTRTAGALMTPLSEEEYDARRRVKNLNVQKENSIAH